MQARAGNEPSQSLKFYNHEEGLKGLLLVESTYYAKVMRDVRVLLVGAMMTLISNILMIIYHYALC